MMAQSRLISKFNIKLTNLIICCNELAFLGKRAGGRFFSFENEGAYVGSVG